MVLNSIIGWTAVIGSWARVEGIVTSEKTKIVYKQKDGAPDHKINN